MPTDQPPKVPEAWVPRSSSPLPGAEPQLHPLGRAFNQFTHRLAQTFGRRHDDHKRHLSLLLPPVAMGLCLWLLSGLVTPETLADLGQTLRAATPQQWVASLVFTALSYYAIGRNDGLAHKLIGSDIRLPRARRAGRAAVAVAQAVGFGTITAAVARKRLLPEIDLWTLARVSITASLAFLAALGALVVVAVLYLKTSAPWLPLSALATAFVLARLLRPVAGLPGLSRSSATRVLFWTALDVGLAAAALWVLLPAGHGVALTTLAAAYILALGIGLLSQSPGGLGAFEVAMILLLPQIPTGQLLAAILAYRITYHIAPALIAVPALLSRHSSPQPTPLTPVHGRAATRAVHRAGQGDWGLVHQGAQIQLSRDQSCGWLTRETGSALVAIGKPLGPVTLHDLSATAHDHGLSPLIYKCDSRTALRARNAGWTVKLLSQEAVIRPALWSIDGPAKRQLRRKLRTATKAGLRIDIAPDPQPTADLTTIHSAWTKNRGPERGFSMGRYTSDLTARQMVLVAYVETAPVAFVSFHQSGPEWGLDLMRITPTAPSGTMHTLVAAAIAQARNAGVQRLSLAACLHPDAGLPGWVPKEDGIQFKSAFDPNWRKLYVAAPGPAALAMGLACVAHAIHWPAPSAKRTAWRHPWRKPRKNPIELAPAPCDAASPDSLPAMMGPHPHQAPSARSTDNDKRPDNPA